MLEGLAFAAVVAVGRIAFTTLVALGPQRDAAPQPSTATTRIVSVQEELHLAAQARLTRAIRESTAEPDSAIVLEIDTPGGEVGLMGEMGHALHKAGKTGGGNVDTVAFVPGGKHGGAISAGAFLAISCDRIYMARGTILGAAQPIHPGPLGPTGAEGKIVEAFAQRFHAMAELHGREWRIAAAFVDPELGLARVRLRDGTTMLRTSRELDELDSRGERYDIVAELKPRGTDRPLALQAAEAFELGFIDGIVADREELMQTIARERNHVVEMAATSGERFVEWISASTPVLLVLGFVLGFIESKVPGFGIAGILSSVCFALVFYGRYLLGVADALEILLFAVGIVLIAVEIVFAPGTLACGILGGLCVLAALILSFQSFVFPRDSIDLGILTRNIASFARVLVVASVGMVGVSLLLPRVLPRAPLVGRTYLPPPTGVEGTGAGAVEEAGSLVGRIAVAATALRPAGVIEIDERRVDAVTEGGFVEQGSRVRIREVTGNRVVVVPEAREA